MADADTFVNLDALHTAIHDAIAAAFPNFLTVEFYRADETAQVACPAALLEMCDIELHGDNGGTGQLPVNLRFYARILIPKLWPNSRIEVRKAAAAVASWLYQRRIPGQMTDPFVVIGCEPDEFKPAAEKFECWQVEWIVPCMLGDSAWTPGGEILIDYLSFAPDIGPPHLDSYVQVSP